MKLVTEYLIIIEKETSEAFYALCDNINEFNKLLQSDSDIKLDGSSLIYRHATNFDYEVKTNGIEGKDQRFFHVKITFNGEEKDIEQYTSLLRSIRGVAHRAGGQPETLWDDVSLYYSYKAYPLIHKIENLMRKLITYFMLTNVGKEWVIETSPTVVMEAIDKSKRKQYLDVLHQIDFSHLGDFLFKAYQTTDVSKLYETLNNAQTLSDLDLEDLKTFIAKSNWERYFSKVVACTDEYLDKRWKQLYDLRCMVAHNALVSRNDYDRIVQLVNEVEGHLQTALENLDKVHVPEEDREQVAENVASNLSATYGDFIQFWKSFEAAIIAVASDWGVNEDASQRFSTPLQILNSLQSQEIIDAKIFKEASELLQFRNRLVHDAGPTLSEQETRSYILRLEELTKALKRSWKDEISVALHALGGEASLTDIYDYIENHSIRNLPENWKSNVRYTLQFNSSDTETFKRGGEDLFRHLGKGRWGLRDIA